MISLRHASMTCATLAFLVLPIGCNPAETPSTTGGEVPKAPTIVDASVDKGPAPTTVAPELTPVPEAPTVWIGEAVTAEVDREVRKASGGVQGEVDGLKATANQAVEGVKDLGEQTRQELQKRIQQKAKDANDGVKAQVQSVRKTAEGLKDEANRRVKSAEDDLKKSAEKALDNLLGPPR